jgi:hypothetical protein
MYNCLAWVPYIIADTFLDFGIKFVEIFEIEKLLPAIAKARSCILPISVMREVNKNIVLENIERIFWLHPAVLGVKSVVGKSDKNVSLYF